MNKHKHRHHSATWYQRSWRPIAAFVYLTICIFDFIIMPVITSASAERTANNQEIFSQISQLEHYQSQVAAIQSLSALRSREWGPLTLGAGGMFHLAFGALLTGAAVTRGLEKKANPSPQASSTNQYGNDMPL